MVAAETVSCTVINTLPSFLETRYVSYLMYPSSSKNTSLHSFKFFLSWDLPSASLLFFFWPISFSSHSFAIASCVFIEFYYVLITRVSELYPGVYKVMCPTAVMPFFLPLLFLVGKTVWSKALGFEFLYCCVMYTYTIMTLATLCL